MLSIVCWKWHRPGYRSTFTGEHVNAMARMCRRHYRPDVRVICVTNDPAGIDLSVEIVPDTADFSDVPSPHGGNNPTCYRRLRMWHPDAARWFGQRFVSLDLDMVLTADVKPVWDRPEDVVLYRDPYRPTQYNGSMVLITAGARPDVWSAFDPNRSPQIARGAGFMGSDQAWLSLRLPGEKTWGPEDGVYSFRKDIERTGKLPGDARIVVMHGRTDPWTGGQNYGWCRDNWGKGERLGA